MAAVMAGWFIALVTVVAVALALPDVKAEIIAIVVDGVYAAVR